MFLFRHKLVKQNDGNGDYIDFTYDSFDRQTEKRYNGDNSQRVTYSYGNNGSVAQITDYFTNSNTRFTYDLAERVVSQREYSGTNKNGGNLLSYTDFTYADKTNYLTGIKHFSPLGTQTIGYTFGVQKDGEMPDQIYKVTWNGNEKVKYTYDNLGRLTEKQIGAFKNNFTYEDVTIADDQRTTTLVKSVATPTGTLTYEYDKLGNILSVTDGTFTTSYEYDSLNQLTRVNDEKAGKTYTYSYDNGNITSQSEYPYTVGDGVLDVPQTTKTWEYEDSVWGDLLTNYNGTPITYDEIGNPLTIGNKELSWTGRQLQSITDGDTEIAYTYNGDGLRTSKTVNGETTNFYYNGSILAGQKTGDDTLVFMYDNNSDIFGVICNGIEYYYIKNAQNDVVAIADADGSILVKYEYDAWGKVVSITDANGNEITDTVDQNAENDIDEAETVGVNNSTDIAEASEIAGVDAGIDPTNADEPTIETATEEQTSESETDSVSEIDSEIAKIANLNPILYRSYYYDKETEWYYLNTRYYSPDMCRFINSDDSDILFEDQDNMLENNLFAYCLNNPINMIDDTGYIAWWIAAAIGGALFDTAAYLIECAITGQKITWGGVGKAALIGAITGVTFGAIGKAAKAASSAIKATKMARKGIGALRKASNAAFKAAKKINKFSISSKHLANAGGRWAKFSTTSKRQINRWIKEALKSKNAVFYPNAGKDGSYYLITNLGRTIGSKGQTSIKVVFDSSGNIWTAIPV